MLLVIKTIPGANPEGIPTRYALMWAYEPRAASVGGLPRRAPTVDQALIEHVLSAREAA